MREAHTASGPLENETLAVGGDKSGGNEKRFYRQLINKANERFDAHLVVIKKQKQKETERK